MKKTYDLFVYFAFTILGGIFTYPLIFKFNTFVPGFFSTDEIFAVLREFWWFKYIWLKHLPETKDILLAAPSGIVRPQLIIYPFWDVLGKYLSILVNPIFAYNIIISVAFILSAVFVYHLSFYLTKNRLSGIFSGVIYAFCPYFFIRIWQHFGLTQIQWIPLYLLALFKLREKKTFSRVVLAALAFFVGITFEFQYAYFMGVVALSLTIFILIYNWRLKLKSMGYLKQNREEVRPLFLSGLLAFLFSLPVIYPTIKGFFAPHSSEASAYNTFLRPFEDLFTQSARPLSYLLPASAHPIFGKFTEQLVGTFLYGKSFTEHTLYLGWVPLILAFIAFREWRKRRKSSAFSYQSSAENFYIGFFIFLAIVAWLFSQPPWWNIFGFKLYMPSFFMYKLLPMFRAYCRFGVVVMLTVAVLAGFGLKFVLERFKTQKTKVAITTLLCGLVLFEFWNYPPFKIIDVSKVPDAYYWIKEQPADFIIAEYPLDTNGANEMYRFCQSKHEKKIINATTPGTYANDIAKNITKLSDFHTAQALKWMGVKYVLVHKEDYLNTGLTEDIEDLNKIPRNSGLKLVKDFPAQECPHKDIMCVQKTGPIDIYEVIALPIKPKI